MLNTQYRVIFIAYIGFILYFCLKIPLYCVNIEEIGIVIMRQCEVYVHDIRAGRLIEDDDLKYTFIYDDAYLARPENPPVSLTLPIRKEPYHSSYLFAPFFNMLSEGENRQMQSQILHIDADDDFGILLATAQTDTIGAVTVKPLNI